MGVSQLFEDFLLQFLQLSSFRVLLSDFQNLVPDLVLLDSLHLLPPIGHDLDLPLFRPLLLHLYFHDSCLSFFHLSCVLSPLELHQLRRFLLRCDKLLILQLRNHQLLFIHPDRALGHDG